MVSQRFNRLIKAMKYKEITGFICKNKDCGAGWQDGRKCSKCGSKVQPGAMTKGEGSVGGMKSTTYDCYRPPRPITMTPVAYRKKFGCVDDNYTRKTNGRFYCNPAHCSKSWKNKAERDEHLNMAYAMLS